MIAFNSVVSFELVDSEGVRDWISQTLEDEEHREGGIDYVFCSDEYLLDKNKFFLNHDTLTDIISFDYTIDKLVSGDIFISIERVKENSVTYETNFSDELHRVMIHGVLHYCGYKDKTSSDKKLMRLKEDYYLSLRKF